MKKLDDRIVQELMKHMWVSIIQNLKLDLRKGGDQVNVELWLGEHYVSSVEITKENLLSVIN